MSKKCQAIRGMKDVLPQESSQWAAVESVFRTAAKNYGYREIRTPVLESTELFKRSVGEVTDIVEKEMYTFEDRNGDSLSLRPEGTAGCMRAGIEAGLFYNQIQRLWYMGPQYRHERPQKGRLRQFTQFGIEAIGINTAAVDAEVILLSARIFKALNLLDHLTLEINSLGSSEDRAAYRELLVDYFSKDKAQLDEDSLRRLESNPLRILDSKNRDLKDIIANAPKMQQHLSEASQAHFKHVCELLEANGIAYTVNPTLVRGLDYYCHTVFEWTTDKLGAQATVCAGGRYDGLVEQLGGKPAPGIGFGLGVERLLLLLEEIEQLPEANAPDAYMILCGEPALKQGLTLAERLRDENPNIDLIVDTANSSFKSQMKRADASNAKVALVIAERESESENVTLKYLRDDKEQETVPQKSFKLD